MLYIAGHPASKKIAQFFADKLSAAGFETRLMPDTESDKGRNAELRDTKARAALIEIGSIDTPESRKAMVDRMDSLAQTLTDAIKAFDAGEADK